MFHTRRSLFNCKAGWAVVATTSFSISNLSASVKYRPEPAVICKLARTPFNSSLINNKFSLGRHSTALLVITLPLRVSLAMMSSSSRIELPLSKTLPVLALTFKITVPFCSKLPTTRSRVAVCRSSL